MSIPYTKNGRNMYDMLSLLQKAIRRGKYNDAGYAANELESIFRSVMWSRIFVISSEDCYGILTKELVRLKEQDDRKKDNANIAKAIALMCKSLKSRDACYFACNFILDSRCPRQIELTEYDIEECKGIFDDESKYDENGFEQMSLFGDDEEEVVDESIIDIAIMYKAIRHRDMDMIGYQMDKLRMGNRNLLWEALKNYADSKVIDEIVALEKADNFVNRNRKDGKKDEIFISKAVMILCYNEDEEVGDVLSSELVKHNKFVDWSKYKVKDISKCMLANNEVPEWVFDCHTIKGKRMGKTDWDMTRDEQIALSPKKNAYFDDASWIYTYAQDVRNGDLSEEEFEVIKEFGKTHEANPVKFIPYF